MAELRGKDYRALRRLSDKDNTTLAEVGETCERVPASSLPALLASGKIAWAVQRRADGARPDRRPDRKGRR